jgi:hypothetical protein
MKFLEEEVSMLVHNAEGGKNKDGIWETPDSDKRRMLESKWLQLN